MSDCIHDVVCRFKKMVEGKCFNVTICKCYEEKRPVSKRGGATGKAARRPGGKRKTGHGTGSHGLDRDYTVSNADMTVIRAHLRNWRYKGVLNENQLAAIDAIGNVRSPSLTDGQREQFLSIFNEVKKPGADK